MEFEKVRGLISMVNINIIATNEKCGRDRKKNMNDQRKVQVDPGNDNFMHLP